jgi:hypothetical protein
MLPAKLPESGVVSKSVSVSGVVSVVDHRVTSWLPAPRSEPSLTSTETVPSQL